MHFLERDAKLNSVLDLFHMIRYTHLKKNEHIWSMKGSGGKFQLIVVETVREKNMQNNEKKSGIRIKENSGLVNWTHRRKKSTIQNYPTISMLWITCIWFKTPHQQYSIGWNLLVNLNPAIQTSVWTQDKNQSMKSCQGSNKEPISQDPMKNMIAILTVTVKMRQCSLFYQTYISNNKEKKNVYCSWGIIHMNHNYIELIYILGYDITLRYTKIFHL